MKRKYILSLIAVAALVVFAVGCVVSDNEVKLMYYEIQNSSAYPVEISVMILFQNSLVIARTVHELEPGESYTEHTDEYGRDNSPGIHVNTSDGVLLRFTATDENGEEVVVQLLYLREGGEDYPMSFYDDSSYDVTYNDNNTYIFYSVTDDHFRLAEEASAIGS